MATPQFPSSFVIERIRLLGYGTGPWRREDLVERWNETTADKLVRDAKDAGWFVSPARGTYFVPPARDLMTVSWLPEPMRTEFLLSRTFAVADIRAWCLSAWCRERGLALGGPLFVTDLGRTGTGEGLAAAPEPVGELAAFSRARAEAIENVPAPEALIIVPGMPGLGGPARPHAVEQAEPPAGKKRTPAKKAIGAVTDGPPDTSSSALPVVLGPDVEDVNWIIALLVALSLGRTQELAQRVAADAPGRTFSRRAMRQHAARIGPPAPNTAWKEAILEGPFPYLLLPPVLWRQQAADQVARRAPALEKLAGGRSAV